MASWAPVGQMHATGSLAARVGAPAVPGEWDEAAGPCNHAKYVDPMYNTFAV